MTQTPQTNPHPEKKNEATLPAPYVQSFAFDHSRRALMAVPTGAPTATAAASRVDLPKTFEFFSMAGCLSTKGRNEDEAHHRGENGTI